VETLDASLSQHLGQTTNQASKNVEGNEMKTIAAFTMALVTLVLATAADADAQRQP
jgi:hypothetical protein